MKPGGLIWNADVETVNYTLPFFLCCICQGEKWLAQGSVTHTHLITFLGPTELSQAVVDAGAVPLLVLCIQEPEIALKRIAASTLSDISKHSPELAQTVVAAGAIAYLAQMIPNPDAKLKVHLIYFLISIIPVITWNWIKDTDVRIYLEALGLGVNKM